MSTNNTITRQRRRADHFKLRLAVATKEIAALRRELREVHHDRFVEGSARTMAAVYRSIDDIMGMWLGQKMLSCRTKTPPFHLPTATEQIVRREIAALLKACEIESVRANEVELTMSSAPACHGHSTRL
jgi:hypothetical protein